MSGGDCNAAQKDRGECVAAKSTEREACGYREETGLYAPVVCGRDKGHTGAHIDFRPNVSIGFGIKPPELGRAGQEASNG